MNKSKNKPLHLAELREDQRRLTLSRLKYFCFLALAVYLGTSILIYLLDPSDFKKEELFIWAFFVASSLTFLFTSRYAKTLFLAKANAALFSMALTIGVFGIFIVYPGYNSEASELLALNLFFVSFIIPWATIEVVGMSLFHIIVYSGLFWISFLELPIAEQTVITFFGMHGYLDGLIFLAVAVIICVAVRHRLARQEEKNFLLLKELETKNRQMTKELAIARDVHRTLIPKSMSTDRASIAVSYVPLDAMGGDYATLHVTKDGNLFFLIGDVTGHGVPAAILVNRVYGEVNALIAENPEPGILMTKLDDFVKEHFEATSMYFSVCAGLLDFNKNTLFYSNYGHPPQILLQHRDNSIFLMKSHTFLLGVGSEAEEQSIYEGKLAFDNKDRIVLFTDGLTETKGPGGEHYGQERLERFVRQNANIESNLFNSKILQEADKYRVGPATDDIFLVTIDIK